MWFLSCHIKRERKRKQTRSQESRLTSQWNGFFIFWVCLLGYESSETTLAATRKKEKERESERVFVYLPHRQFGFSNNSKFPTWKFCFLLQ